MNRWRGGLLVLVLASAAPAADPVADPQAFDRKVYDTLRAVHDYGADLYNTKKDFAAAYRVYDGALRTVRPLLDHRPKVQERIDTGLTAAGKETEAARQAFVLHETIEEVRAALKTPAAAPKVVVPAKKPEPVPEPKKPEPKPEVKKPEVKPEKKPDPVPTKKAEPPAKPVDPDRIAPPPRKKGAAKPPAAATAQLSGTVTFKDKPLAAASVVLAAADGTAFTVVTAADGTYRLAEPIPPGKYRVAVRSFGVPAKYGDPSTSGLTVELKKGDNVQNLALQ